MKNSDTVSISTMAHDVQFDDSEDISTVTTLCYPGFSDVFFRW